MKAIIPPFIQDTREQTPWKFGHQTIIQKLEVGDYSVDGIQDKVCVERKRHEELVNCFCGDNRDRFQRELERGANLHRLHVVVEASFKGVIECLYENWPSAMHPAAIRGTIAAWENRYNHVRFWFCGDRETAQTWTEHLLKRAWADFQEKKVRSENAPV